MINSHCRSEWLTVGLMLKTFLFHKSFLPYIAFFFFFFRTTPRTVTKTFWAYPLFPFFHFLIFLVSCSRLSWHMSVFEHTLKIAYSMALYHMTGSPSEWLTAVSQCVSVCVWSVEWLTAALRESDWQLSVIVCVWSVFSQWNRWRTHRVCLKWVNGCVTRQSTRPPTLKKARLTLSLTSHTRLSLWVVLSC